MNNKNPKNIIMNLSEKTPLLRYNNDEDFRLWQNNAKEKLIELLGISIIPSCNDNLTINSVKNCGDYTDTYFTFQSEPGYYVPCHMLKPVKPAEKLPLLICMQGHTTGMHISIGESKYACDEDDILSGDRDYARIGVKKGYCTIAVEQRYMGECGGTDKGPGCQFRPPEGINTLPTLLFGRTAIGERVHDTMRAIDVISNNTYTLFDCIDTDDITLTGNSGGGTTTFYTSCIDERIKICVPSCSICTYKDSIINLKHCSCNYIPSIARYFDMGDLAGLIAPRKLIIVAGKDDKIFPLHGVKQTFSLAKTLFFYAGAEDNIQLIIGNGGHRFYADETFKAISIIRSV